MKSGALPMWIWVWFWLPTCGGGTVLPKSPNGVHGSHETDAHAHFDVHPEPTPSLFQFNNDYDSARADAELHLRPLFILMTATWCEPCAILHRNILTDPRLSDLLSQFTLLSADIDSEAAFEAYRLFPVKVWPTGFIVNPCDESVAARLQGFAAVTEMDTFLRRGLRTFRDFITSPEGDFSTVFPKIRSGRHLAGEGKFASAVDAFKDALASMPENSPQRRATSALLVESAANSGRYAECVQAAMSLPSTARLSAQMLIRAASCADLSGSRVKHLYNDWVRPRFLSMITLSDETVVATEKSSAFAFLAAEADERRDLFAAQDFRQRHFDFLKTVLLFSTDEAGISSLEIDRVRLYLKMNQVDALHSLFQTATQQNQRDWRPFYLTAFAEYLSGRYQAAATAADLAYQLAEDPSRLEILWLLADIFSADGDREKELDVLRTMAEYIEVLPGAILSAEQLLHTSARLKKLEAVIEDE